MKNDPIASEEPNPAVYVLLTVLSTVGIGSIFILLGSKTPVVALAGALLDPHWRFLLGLKVTNAIIARSLGLGLGGLLAGYLWS